MSDLILNAERLNVLLRNWRCMVSCMIREYSESEERTSSSGAIRLRGYSSFSIFGLIELESKFRLLRVFVGI